VVWSPRGDRLAAQIGQQIISLDPTTGESVDLGGGLIEPVWSPDGGQIALTRGPAPDRADVVVVDPATGVMIFEWTRAAGDSAPVWSPDSRWLAVRTIDLAGESFTLIDLRTGQSRTVMPPESAAFYQARWSQDSRWLALTARNWERPVPLLLSDLAGETRLIGTAGAGVLWSPEGSRLAVARGASLYTAAAQTLFDSPEDLVVIADGAPAFTTWIDERRLVYYEQAVVHGSGSRRTTFTSDLVIAPVEGPTRRVELRSRGVLALVVWEG
jgi:dipeptidyl aminopeptidase/acylaminoacyl peptidase